MRKIVQTLLCFSISFILGSCGIKPDNVSAPQGESGAVVHKIYPRTYPDMETDPKP